MSCIASASTILPETSHLSSTAESSRDVTSELVLRHLVSTLTYLEKGLSLFLQKAIRHGYHTYKRNFAARARITHSLPAPPSAQDLSAQCEETKQKAQPLLETAYGNPVGKVQYGAPPRALKENLSFTFLAPRIHTF